MAAALPDYTQILAGYAQLADPNSDYNKWVTTYGDAQIADTKQSFADALGTSMARLGAMRYSTVAPSIRTGNAKQEALAEAQIADAAAKTKGEYMSNQSARNLQGQQWVAQQQSAAAAEAALEEWRNRQLDVQSSYQDRGLSLQERQMAAQQAYQDKQLAFYQAQMEQQSALAKAQMANQMTLGMGQLGVAQQQAYNQQAAYSSRASQPLDPSYWGSGSTSDPSRNSYYPGSTGSLAGYQNRAVSRMGYYS